MLPAGVDAGLGGKAQPRTRGVGGTGPATRSLCLSGRSSQTAVRPPPPPSPGSVVFASPSPVPWTSLPNAPLNRTSPSGHHYPVALCSVSSSRPRPRELPWEGWAHLLPLQSSPPVCKPFSFDLVLSPPVPVHPPVRGIRLFLSTLVITFLSVS